MSCPWDWKSDLWLQTPFPKPKVESKKNAERKESRKKLQKLKPSWYDECESELSPSIPDDPLEDILPRASGRNKFNFTNEPIGKLINKTNAALLGNNHIELMVNNSRMELSSDKEQSEQTSRRRPAFPDLSFQELRK